MNDLIYDLLVSIREAYSESLYNKTLNGACSGCGGCGETLQGGDWHNCYYCGGDGVKKRLTLRKKEFCDKMEKIMFGEKLDGDSVFEKIISDIWEQKNPKSLEFNEDLPF